MNEESRLRRYHAPVWDEPIVMEVGRPGRRAVKFPNAESGIRERVGEVANLLPANVRREDPPSLPELSEYEVLRHYLHLSQETLGMIGISLFGTCTMKYNPAVNEQVTRRPEVAEIHPQQDPETMQGILEILHECDLMLRELSGMDQFVFQPGGGAHGAYAHAALTRAYHAARGELEQRDQVIVTIQTHPCNAATAAAAGFEVVTLALEEDGYPSVDALKAAVSDRTAALMVNNPDDMGIYNPDIKEWVDIVHDAGGIAFYDHANFNGLMGKVRARELGFDACMFMLHKTFGAPKGGLGPAVGAYGCMDELAEFLPAPIVERTDDGYTLDYDRPNSLGRVREYIGNVPQVIKAYSWLRAMGAEGIHEARDLSVLANNYMGKKLLEIPGVTISNPQNEQWRMEMTRYSLEKLTQDTGVTTIDVQERMTDYGIDAPWLSHEPWLVPEPITPEAGELWSKEDLDYWIAVLAQVSREAYSNPEIVKTAPHNQPVHRLSTEEIEDPSHWAMTWSAYLKKGGQPRGTAAKTTVG